jgi:2-polyprenyl-3-methyl-5-hydroxy-6-metoxy-1,4-benzoquinol methylase
MVEWFSKYINPGDKILDYGCGVGVLIEGFLQNQHETYGIEFSDDSTKKLNQKFASDKNFKGVYSMENLPDKEFIDLVVCTEVIEHVNEKQLHETFDNIYKILKPGGQVIFTTPNQEVLEDSIVYCPISEVSFHRWQHVRSWSPSTLSKYSEEKGFKSIDAQELDFTIPPEQYTKQLKRAKMKSLLRKATFPKPHLMYVAQK